MADFDVNDKNSWYVGKMSREEANGILQLERESGAFLVRDQSGSLGGFVLCVKEDKKVSHYIIKPLNVDGGVTRFLIGDQEFSSLPALLTFYKKHYLDTTPLIRPALRPKYVAKFQFAGKDADDLPFEKGEILSLVRKDEDQWWTASNAQGQIGLVPVPYIEPFTESSNDLICDQLSTSLLPPTTTRTATPVQPVQRDRVLPCRARVIKNRIPSAYDKSQLKLQIGEEIVVIAMPVSGQWEGRLQNGIQGIFPFTHIEFIDD